MKWRCFGLLLFCVGWISLSSCQVEHPPTGQQSPTRQLVQPLIGGVVDLRFPAIGALVDGGGPFCTGTLIASRIVLTAAHCVDNKTLVNMTFRIDLPDNNADGFTANYYEFDSQFIATHPNWDGNLSNGADIAIGILKKPVPAQVAEPLGFLTTPMTSAWLGRKLTFLGYGLIQSVPDAKRPKTKHGGDIPIVEIYRNVFLTFDQDVSTCHGDSGGPGLAQLPQGWTIIGVNSFSTSALVPGSTPSRTRCDMRSGVARVDIDARFIQSWVDRFGDAPGACQQDTDCRNCQYCNTTTGQCQRRTTISQSRACQPCTTDADCGADALCHRFDQGFRCMQRCAADGCCPGGTKCRLTQGGNETSWFCAPDGNICPPTACQDASECGPGELCDQGFCKATRPARAANLCFPCETHEACQQVNADALCLGPPGQGTCSQPCGDADFCPNGFVCRQPYAGSPKQCVPFDGTCRINCTDDQGCPTDFTCQSNVCTRTGGGKQGDFCDPMPCREGLLCAPTKAGRRCLRPCGTPPGRPGSRCLPSDTCLDGALCQSVSDTQSVCLQPCQSDSACKGGTCRSGVCLCQQDQDCDADAYCNRSSGHFPSCVAKTERATCDQGWSCQPLGEERFCVRDQRGSVPLGQPCDPFHRCRPGLACITQMQGSRCLEDCTASRQCKAGGFCSAEKDGIALCVCRRDENCRGGRACSPPFYLEQFGSCLGENQTANCIADVDCPNAQICTQGFCTPAPPEPEPTEELLSEPTQDAAEALPPEPSPEPVPEPTRQKEPAIEPTPEPASPEASRETPTPPTGCGCTQHRPTTPSSLWLLLTGILFWIRPRRR